MSWGFAESTEHSAPAQGVALAQGSWPLLDRCCLLHTWVPLRSYAFVAWEFLGTSALVTATSLAPPPLWPPSSLLSIALWCVCMSLSTALQQVLVSGSLLPYRSSPLCNREQRLLQGYYGNWGPFLGFLFSLIKEFKNGLKENSMW